MTERFESLYTIRADTSGAVEPIRALTIVGEQAIAVIQRLNATLAGLGAMQGQGLGGVAQVAAIAAQLNQVMRLMASAGPGQAYAWTPVVASIDRIVSQMQVLSAVTASTSGKQALLWTGSITQARAFSSLLDEILAKTSRMLGPGAPQLALPSVGTYPDRYIDAIKRQQEAMTQRGAGTYYQAANYPQPLPQITAWAESLNNRTVDFKIVENLQRALYEAKGLTTAAVGDINKVLASIGSGVQLTGTRNIAQQMYDLQEAVFRTRAALMAQPGSVLPGLKLDLPEADYNRLVEGMKLRLATQAQTMDTLQRSMAATVPSQWQEMAIPGWGVQPVGKEYAQQVLKQQLKEHEAALAGLGGTEEQLDSIVSKVNRSMAAQGKTVQTKTGLLQGLTTGTIGVTKGEKDLAVIQEAEDRKNQARNRQIDNQVGFLASRFMRHMTWIAQGILVWGAINAIQNLGREYIAQFSAIEQAAARAADVVGTSTQEMITTQLELAGQVTEYGIQPTALGPGIITMAQYGVDQKEYAQVTTDAAKLSMYAQMEMGDATSYLLSIERQWNIEAENGARVLDLLYTMYQRAPGAMRQFLELMQEGPGAAQDMGMAFEEYMLTVANMMSYLPNRTAISISSTLGRVLTLIRTQGEIPLASKYGINIRDLGTQQLLPGIEVLDALAAKFKTLKTESEKAELSRLIAGSRQGQSWRDMFAILKNWDMIRDIDKNLSDFDEGATDVADTLKTKFGELTGEFTLLVQEIGRVTDAIGRLTTALEDITTMVKDIKDIATAFGEIGSVLDSLAGKEGVLTRMKEAARYGPLAPLYLAFPDQFKKFQQFTGLTGFGPGGLGPTDIISAVPETVGKMKLSFQSIASLLKALMAGGPGGVVKALSQNPEDFMEIQKARETASATGGQSLMSFAINYAVDKLKESGNVFRNDVGAAGEGFKNDVSQSAAAIRKAVLVAQLGQGWTPPMGITDLTGRGGSQAYTTSQVNVAIAKAAADQAAQFQAYKSFLISEGVKEPGLSEYLKNFTDKMMMQYQFYRLPGGEIKLMEGADLLFYLSQIEENTRPLQGIWNVPPGMRVWVPIESTFYGEWRNRQGAGGGGGGALDTSPFEKMWETILGLTTTTNAAYEKYLAGRTIELRKAGEERFADKYGDWGRERALSVGLKPLYQQPSQAMVDKAMIATAIAAGLSGLPGTMAGAITKSMSTAAATLPTYKYAPDVGPAVQKAVDIALRVAMPGFGGGKSDALLSGINATLRGSVGKVQPVSFQPSQMATGVHTGILHSGLSLTSSSTAVSARISATAAVSQLSLLAMIERNTRYHPAPAATGFNAKAGASGGTTGTTNAGAMAAAALETQMYKEWRMSSGTYSVPT